MPGRLSQNDYQQAGGRPDRGSPGKKALTKKKIAGGNSKKKKTSAKKTGEGGGRKQSLKDGDAEGRRSKKKKEPRDNRNTFHIQKTSKRGGEAGKKKT